MLSTDIIFMRIFHFFSTLILLLFIISCISSGTGQSPDDQDHIFRIDGLKKGDTILKDISSDQSEHLILLRDKKVFVINRETTSSLDELERVISLNFTDLEVVQDIYIENIQISTFINEIFFSGSIMMQITYKDGEINDYRLDSSGKLLISNISEKKVKESLEKGIVKSPFPDYFVDNDMYMISLMMKYPNEENINLLIQKIRGLKDGFSEHGIEWDKSLLIEKEKFFKEPVHHISE